MIQAHSTLQSLGQSLSERGAVSQQKCKCKDSDLHWNQEQDRMTW